MESNPVISEKNIMYVCKYGSEQWFIMEWLILDLLDVLWRKYDIHFFPSCHHKRYVGRNLYNSLFMKFFLFLLFFPSWFEMPLGSHHCPSSILARRAQPRKSLRGQGIGPFSLK